MRWGMRSGCCMSTIVLTAKNNVRLNWANIPSDNVIRDQYRQAFAGGQDAALFDFLLRHDLRLFFTADRPACQQPRDDSAGHPAARDGRLFRR